MSFSIQDQNPFTGIDFAMSLDRRAVAKEVLLQRFEPVELFQQTLVCQVASPANC